jgi:hypothetical protein
LIYLLEDREVLYEVDDLPISNTENVIMESKQIDIDMEVYKSLENRRRSFLQSHNHILRELLGLDPGVPEIPVEPLPQVKAPATVMASAVPEVGVQKSRPTGPQGWRYGDLFLQNGTQVRLSWTGTVFSGMIVQGNWVVEGQSFRSPSRVAEVLTKTKASMSHKYWEVLRPGSLRWIRLDKIAASKPEGKPEEDIKFNS